MSKTEANMSKETDPFLQTLPNGASFKAPSFPPQEMVRNTEVVEMSVQTDRIDMAEEYLPLRPMNADGPRECTCGAKEQHQDDAIRSTSSSPPVARIPSRSSLSSATQADVCRICHCEAEPNAPLISPCACLGSLKYVHQACLQQWIKSSDTKSCELCKYDFQMTTRIKPFRKWKKLEMTTVERRKIMCSVTFHIIAITCVIWSLYVLIDRTTEEIRTGKLEWPFWTKLIVVAIGFTGGLVFMYVQCKMYVQLCRRWRAYNRVIYIQDSPLAPPPTSASNAEEAETKFTGNSIGNRELATIDEVHTSTA